MFIASNTPYSLSLRRSDMFVMRDYRADMALLRSAALFLIRRAIDMSSLWDEVAARLKDGYKN